MILVLYVFHELNLGTASQWEPFLAVIKDCVSSCWWNDDDLGMIEDEQTALLVKAFNKKLDDEWEYFENVLIKNSAIFKSQMTDVNMFFKVYHLVTAKSEFSNEMGGLFLAPYLCFLKHSTTQIGHEMINVDLHLNDNEEYYNVTKYTTDHSELFAAHNQTWKPHFNKKVFDANVKDFSYDNLESNIMSNEMHIWESPYTLDYCREDNDSEDEDGPKLIGGRAKPHKDLSFFYALEAKDPQLKLDEAAEAKGFNELLNKAYFKGRNLKLAQIQAKLASKAADSPDFDILRVREGTLDLLEFVPVKKPESLAQMQKTWLADGEINEEEDEYGWLSKDVEENTYLVISNESRTMFQQGSEASFDFVPWSRTNLFLLYSYGICVANNQYDSFKIYLNLNIPKGTEVTHDVMLAKTLGSSEAPVLEVRLKLHQFNQELMSYMRYVFRSDFGGDKLALTRVQDLEFEKFCLDQYMKMIFRQIKAAEAKSTLEADLLSMKSQELSANQKSALTMRISKKSILRYHVNLSEYLLEYINESATIFQELKGQGLSAIDKMTKELYMK